MWQSGLSRDFGERPVASASVKCQLFALYNTSAAGTVTCVLNSPKYRIVQSPR